MSNRRGAARAPGHRAIREAQEEALAFLVLLSWRQAGGIRPPECGRPARVTSLGVIGEGDEPGAGRPVELAVSGKRLVVPRSEVLAVAGPAPSGGTSVPAPTSKGAGGGRAEINLVGMTVDEALPEVDKLLDEAAMGDRKELRLIHGFGSGRLRKAVAKMLEGHPHVAAVRVGAEGRGGVTVVELKE